MLRKICRYIFFVLIIITFFNVQVMAKAKINGNLSDPVEDSSNPAEDVVALSWNIDNSFANLNLYVYRLANEGDWNYSVNIISGPKKLRLDVECLGSSDDVFTSTQNINLYDTTSNSLIYSSTTQWFLGVFSYVQIPFKDVVDSMESGFEIDFSVISGEDIAPDSGYVKISTIPTYPWYFNLSLLAFPLIGIYFWGVKSINKKLS